MIYDRMTHEHGYSVRRLAQKLGKDKGYIENRLRLAGAPTEIKQLVSLRKDTLSHAYELLKVEDPKKRRKLAEQVASGELSLVKLREKIEGRPRVVRVTEEDADEPVETIEEVVEPGEPTPRIEYSEAEHDVWRIVSRELAPKHERYACREFRTAAAALALPTDRIPQLDEVTAGAYELGLADASIVVLAGALS